MSMLDFSAILNEAPPWALECHYCHPEDFGAYDQETHQRAHLPMLCRVCGLSSPNRLLFDMSHGINLGASWEYGWMLCTSLALKINHLRAGLRTGRAPQECDRTPLELGWTFAPDGWPIAPPEWPVAPDTWVDTSVQRSHDSETGEQ